MIICKLADETQRIVKESTKDGQKSGFIPTMGALHDGHISLIQKSIQAGNFTSCSIFVNPTQFNNPADFAKYPSTLSSDIDKLEEAGCDLLFLPSQNEIYPPDFKPPHYKLGYLESVFEGKYRPGHFQGVCMVVDRLLKIMQPTLLYLGQKDYQQCMVISKMVSDLGIKTEIAICPTLRENSGLAMSSRNMRLTADQKTKAPLISTELLRLKKNIREGNVDSILEESIKTLDKAGFKVDYFSVANAANLQPVTNWDGQSKIVGLAAAFLGEIRLIDNMLLN
ncbi:MAG: pantoate--beta-alanine ligase [Bacteroidetes bacterium]|nr:pantoate--beta-alanine ligase [Bacteroidota bacterium]